MSSIGLHRTHARGRAGTGAIAVVILLLFLLVALISAQRKDITQGFDEVAHASYVAHLQTSGEFWPKLEDMRMLDPRSLRFTTEANYLNHPPFYYWLLARLGPTIENNRALLVHRVFNILLGALGLAALLAIGLYARFEKLTFAMRCRSSVSGAGADRRRSEYRQCRFRRGCALATLAANSSQPAGRHGSRPCLRASSWLPGPSSPASCSPAG